MRSASALIIWNNKILLFHRDDIPTIPYPNYWSLPGGIVEKGETRLQGIKRELQEEVSHVPKSLHFLTKISVKDENEKAFLYYSFVDSKEAKLFKHGPGEGQGIAFFTLKDTLNLKLHPVLKKYFLKFEKELLQGMKAKK